MVLCHNPVPMQIEIGKLYQNRTLKYLVPALNYYGETLKTKLNLVFKLAFGVHDTLIDGTHLEGQKNIYILIDKEVRPDLYLNFMGWIKNQEYYVTDYVFDELHNGRKQLLVLAFPPALSDAYDKFLKGQYSYMYSRQELSQYFNLKPEPLQILQRTFLGKTIFKSLIKETFDVTLEEVDFRNERFEYDIPPSNEEEFFNYKREV